MNVLHLVKMANQIGQFYHSLPDRAEAVKGTADHLRRFWDPRMRKELLRYLDQTQGKDLDPMVLEALQTYRKNLTPPETTAAK
jgi:formate dehydrogenase subunit delta